MKNMSNKVNGIHNGIFKGIGVFTGIVKSISSVNPLYDIKYNNNKN